jgi:hypothetical protein
VSAPPELLAAALAYADDGLPVFPCDAGSKRPLTEHGFTDASRDPATIAGWWKRWPSAMIGMPTGEPSGVWVLDVDDPASFAASAPALPRTREVKTGKGFHLHWRRDPENVVRNAQRHPRTGWPFPDMHGAEVRGDGGYVILPPSRHPSGRLYAWADDREPVAAPADLLAIVTKRPGRASDSRERGSQAINGAAGGDTPYGLKALADECAAIRAAGDGEQEHALNSGALKIGALVAGGELDRATARRDLLAAGLAMPSFDLGHEWKTDSIAAKIDRALSHGAARPRSAQGKGRPDDWPEPSPLGDELRPVLPCRADMLPIALRPWLGDIAERMNVPLDMVAIPALVASGGLIGRRVGIRPQQQTDWQEAGNLWGCVVAPPGAKKSPAASEALGPLKALEGEAAEANAAALADHELAKRVHKLTSEKADKAARKAIETGGDAMEALRAAPAPDAPIERRYLTSDATAEKLGEICAANPHGVTVHRDELMSLFADLDREERASARGFFLSGWNGSESYTFDRIARGTVRIPAVNISLFGTTQPDRLARYMADSLQRFNDGMVQRLQLLAWPDFNGAYVECDRAALSVARQAAWRFYSELATIDTQELRADYDFTAGPGHFPFLRFAPDAQVLFSGWMEGLERQLCGGQLEPALIAHLAKYRGLAPRLALLCHIANNATGPVSGDAVQMAVRWADYLESHARRAYAALSLDNVSAARSIWRRIMRNNLPEPFTARDIQRKGWSGLTQRERVEGGLKALCDADWLAGRAPEAGPGGGRPSKLYRPNPKALARSDADALKRGG